MEYTSFTDTLSLACLCLGVTVFLCILVSVRRYYSNLCKFNIPPGPWGLPVVGYLPFLGQQPQETLLRLRYKYGDVYSLQLGSIPTIVVNGRLVIRDMLLNSTGVFDERPGFYHSRMCEGRSAFGDYSEKWIMMKNTVVAKFLTFINNKEAPLDELLEDEISKFALDILSYKGQPFDPRSDIYVSCSSLMYQILFGRDKSIRHNAVFKELLHQRNFGGSVAIGNPTELIPWLTKRCQFFAKPKLDIYSYITQMRKRIVTEHRTHFIKETIRDLTDVFLATEGLETPEMASVGLGAENLLQTLDEIFSGGVDTLAATMQWILLFLVKFPNVQQQIYKETDKALHDRAPTCDNKKDMPYTEAVILESLRFKPALPLAIPHCVRHTARIGEFVVPKGTAVLINIHSLARDGDIWEYPNTFNPDNFLTQDGQLKTEKAMHMYSFGIGHRKCVGDLLSRNFLFIWLTRTVQKFQILPVEGENYSLTGVHGRVDSPKPYRLIVVER